MSFLDLKEQLSFAITFARLWYGKCPFDDIFYHKMQDEPDHREGCPFMYLELKDL